MAKTKIAVNVKVPTDRIELNERISELGRNERIREKIALEMNEAIAKIKKRYAEDVKEYDDKISELLAGIAAYCEVHRDELTENGKSKTVSLPAGTISWRICPPSCRLTKPEVIMELLKRKGLHRFIRVKEEISKDMILAEPTAVAGVKGITIIKGKEELAIEPDRSELEKVA
jgi:phage host-nuclease inhibitor protein Gam